MFLRRSTIVLALAGCPQHAPPEPPRDPPPAVGGGAQGLRTPEPARAEGGSRIDGAAEGSEGSPALSAPGGGEALADVLAPRERASAPRSTGGCQDGARQAGESWRVECNTCYCGDDGQVTCTAMACNVPVARSG